MPPMMPLPEFLAFVRERLDETDARDRAEGRLPSRQTETARQVVAAFERERGWELAYTDVPAVRMFGLLRAVQILAMTYHDHPDFDEMWTPPEWGHGWWLTEEGTPDPVSSDPTS